MKIRIKFSKYGALKFIGHLDVMRYFQKLIRRSKIPVAYSTGLSPHQVMSFALPLGIGLTSEGEYLDIEITEAISSKAALLAMNENTVEGIEILSFKQLDDSAENAMSSVKAADYLIEFRENMQPDIDLNNQFKAFISQNKIEILKTTKKSERIVDIKPFIYRYDINKNSIKLRLCCGSVDNTKPELVMEAFYNYLSIPFDEYALLIKRLDLLTGQYPSFISLNDIGEDIDE